MAFSSYIKNKIRPEYSSNLVEEFYRPVLREADLYQRVS